VARRPVGEAPLPPVITSRVVSEPGEIGLVLRKLREDAGLSQRELANQLGVQQPAVARWEGGGVQMPINSIDEILSHFGHGVEYDLTAVPLDEAVRDGVPLQMVRRRPEVQLSPREQSRVRSGGYEFAVNRDAEWCGDIWEAETGRKLPGAVAVHPARIDVMVPHPDGALIRFGRTVGKITPNAKRHGTGVWYSRAPWPMKRILNLRVSTGTRNGQSAPSNEPCLLLAGSRMGPPADPLGPASNSSRPRSFSPTPRRQT